jgi:hypothetical protein
MKSSVGGGDESKDSNATLKTTTAGPEGRQFRECSDVRSANPTRKATHDRRDHPGHHRWANVTRRPLRLLRKRRNAMQRP